MPRPVKYRKVCQLPENNEFIAASGDAGEHRVILTVDEYEAIRLIDKEGFSQEECSAYMGVARTTVQQIYLSARKKIADALVSGFSIRIEGGRYRLCDGAEEVCGCGGCKRHRRRGKKERKGKDGMVMKIAVTYENGAVFQHFGHTKQFKVYEAEDGKIISSEIVDTNGKGHGALAGVLQDIDADVLICGGIGGGAKQALAEAGIELYGGVSGDPDQAASDFIAGKLQFNPDVMCNHHGEHHGDHGHGGCGSHDGHGSGGCGSHKCGH